jgi:hypothetical protein
MAKNAKYEARDVRQVREAKTGKTCCDGRNRVGAHYIQESIAIPVLVGTLSACMFRKGRIKEQGRTKDSYIPGKG